MYHIGHWDWTFTGDPRGLDRTAPGYARRSLVDRTKGATHTDVGICRLAGGTDLTRHLHSHEEAIYVLGGHPVLEFNARRYRLGQGDYAFFPVGVAHALSNPEPDEARWMDLNTPQERPGARASTGTILLPGDGSPDGPAIQLAELGQDDPTTMYLGHYEGTPPIAEAVSVSGSTRGRATAGMNTAILAYSGISVKMMVDQNLGAELLTMFMVDYEPGGAAQVHDHPFEEVYFFLEGEIQAELDDEVLSLASGDVLFCDVGATHGFFNDGRGRVRWIETQAPQPPRRHAYRWPSHWERLRENVTSRQSSIS
ncbi:MAG: cupin domain-containing protein [Acidimicrobiales bacterium]|jgi:quercetin dioxygenase-like cupin family protein